MNVLGKTVVGNGTIVLETSESGAIDVDGKLLEVRFLNNGGPGRVDVDPATGEITFSNSDDASLGSFMSLSPTIAGTTYQMRLALWAIGTPISGRVLHYTVVRA